MKVMQGGNEEYSHLGGRTINGIDVIIEIVFLVEVGPKRGQVPSA